jgi:inosine-uridine nucleoside N-ribohydrolase
MLITGGVALTVVFGVSGWFALVVATAILVLAGVLLHRAYVMKPADAVALPQLEQIPDDERVPVIYDCDLTMGRLLRDVGDGLALLYLLGEPGIDVQSVTTTYGNGPVGMTTRTTRRLLGRLDLRDVDVVAGASGPNRDPKENEAARHLADSVDARPGEIVLLATGAMTNLKHARALDPDFFKKLRSLYLRGGVTGELAWNERQLLERNFSLDPEAAYRAIQAACPTTIALGESGLTAILRSPQFAALQELGDPVSKLIVQRTRLWFAMMRLWFRDDGFAMWESIAAVAIAHPELLRFERVHLPTTITDLRTGRLATDPDRGGPVRLIRGVEDYEGVIAAQFAAWHRLGQSIETNGKELS